MRFPGFEEEWQVKKLGNIIDFKVTNSFSRENLNYETGTIKNIHYGDIHTKFQTLFDLEKEVVPYINEEISLNRISEDFYCQEGDIVFADASEDLNDVGKSIEIINLNGEKLLSGLHTLLARPNKEYFHKGFNGYLFKSKNVRNQIQKEAQGSKVLSINVGRISNVKLNFPSLEEQQKISSLLSLIDERISTQKKIISHLETLMQDSRESIFSQKIKFKDDNGIAFPKWDEKKLKDILIEVNAKSVVKNQYRIISSTAKGLFYQDEYFTRDIASQDNTGYRILKKGQLVFSPQNLWLGNINVNSDFEIGLVSPSYKIFDFDENMTNALFCRFFLKTSTMLFEFGQSSIQGASVVRRNLDLNLFFNIKFLFPSLFEQTKIASFLSSIDEKIQIEKKILVQFELQKKYLLSNLFV